MPELEAPQLLCKDPGRALGQLLELFREQPSPRGCGVDPRAAVDETARVDTTAWVGPFCYVGPEVTIEAEATIEPFTYIGPRCRVGRGCRIGPGATLGDCTLGDDVVVGPGAVIGFRGFGFWREAAGWHPIPSASGVVIEDGVEIGANSCIDRGTLSETRVGKGTKIDNQVQVGHNATLGRRVMLCAQVGLAGSVQVDDDCVLGGQVGVADHLQIGRGARVGAHSGVARDVPEGAVLSGYPAFDHRKWLRSSVLVTRLAELAREVRQLSERVAALASRP
jgi:UDP-3-O-[3-hydroxymyristoyl] glucosamine N-acyltransferase